jgi:hypothetical protein
VKVRPHRHACLAEPCLREGRVDSGGLAIRLARLLVVFACQRNIAARDPCFGQVWRERERPVDDSAGLVELFGQEMDASESVPSVGKSTV